MTATERIAEAWRQAAAALGIHFVSPFALEHEGKKVAFVGLISDFGSERGMLIFFSDVLASEPWATAAKKEGYGYSCLSESYEAYDRKLFVETLDDWGWTPKDRPPPSWYTRAPWTA